MTECEESVIEVVSTESLFSDVIISTAVVSLVT